MTADACLQIGLQLAVSLQPYYWKDLFVSTSEKGVDENLCPVPGHLPGVPIYNMYMYIHIYIYI